MSEPLPRKDISLARRNVFFLLGLLGSITAALTFCGNNTFHEKQAAGVLTMKECLECHNTKIVPCLGKDCMYTNNHPLMHTYPPEGKERRYASISEIQQAGCVLEDGKITCLSCHDLTKPPPRTIRAGDQLCLICHKDKE